MREEVGYRDASHKTTRRIDICSKKREALSELKVISDERTKLFKEFVSARLKLNFPKITALGGRILEHRMGSCSHHFMHE